MQDDSERACQAVLRGDSEVAVSATFILRAEGERQSFMTRLRGLALPLKVVVKDADARSLDQNAALWAMLSDVSDQVEWYGNQLKPEEWKHVFTAALKRYKVVPGLDGGFVAVGMSTSAMSKREFSELLELIQAFGNERGVRWSASQQEAA